MAVAKPKHETVEDLALAIDPWVVMPQSDQGLKLSLVVEQNGWEGAKAYFPSVREFLEGLQREGLGQ